MLFDLRPKSSRSELFNREEELSVLDAAISRGDPLVIVLGIRRIGKTSLLKSFLENWYGVYVDMRGVRREVDLYERLSEGLSSSLGKLKRLLKDIRGVKISTLGVELKYKGRDSISLLGLLEELNRRRKRVIVVFDEAQLIRPPLSAELKNIIAYSYDNLENITIILSGSEVGLLREFIGVDNPESPLYGRYFRELVVKRFSRKLSEEFLEKGFHELGVKVDSEVLSEALDLFNGIVGWLVFFGRSYVDGVRNVGRILDMAVNIALREIGKLSFREKTVLKAIAEGAHSWSAVRKYVEEKTGITIPKSSLSRTIEKLEKLSIVKNYEFLDPIYRHASKRIKVRHSLSF